MGWGGFYFSGNSQNRNGISEHQLYFTIPLCRPAPARPPPPPTRGATAETLGSDTEVRLNFSASPIPPRLTTTLSPLQNVGTSLHVAIIVIAAWHPRNYYVVTPLPNHLQIPPRCMCNNVIASNSEAQPQLSGRTYYERFPIKSICWPQSDTSRYPVMSCAVWSAQEQQ